MLDLPFRIDDAGEDFRAADIDADDSLVSHVWRTVRNHDRQRGYHGPPNVGSSWREAVPRLPRRSGQGQGPDDSATDPRAERHRRRAHRLPRARREASSVRLAKLELEALDWALTARPHARSLVLDRCRLSLVPRRRQGREQAPAGNGAPRPRSRRRDDAGPRERHPPARHRPLAERITGI